MTKSRASGGLMKRRLIWLLPLNLIALVGIAWLVFSLGSTPKNEQRLFQTSTPLTESVPLIPMRNNAQYSPQSISLRDPQQQSKLSHLNHLIDLDKHVPATRQPITSLKGSLDITQFVHPLPPFKPRSVLSNSGPKGPPSVRATWSQAKQHGIAVVVGSLAIGDGYDFACKESELHKCACQISCGKAGPCTKAINICKAHEGCHLLSFSGDGSWATLKRRANLTEIEELSFIERAVTSNEWQQIKAAIPSSPPKAPFSFIPQVEMKSTIQDAFGLTFERLSSSLTSIHGKFCGESRSIDSKAFLDSKLGIVALSYGTPATLKRSMASWKAGGLLDLVNERIALLGAPSPADLAIAATHGFSVMEPRLIPGAKPVKNNVLTIGQAFYHALVHAKSDYILFLEKDFALDTELPMDTIKEELVASMWMLERGIPIIRTRSRKEQGCGTFRNCVNDANKPNWKGSTTMARRRNWWSFYCDDAGRPGAQRSGVNIDDRMSQCISQPKIRCFSSYDSNWSLNAVLVHRESMLTKVYQYSNGRSFGTIAGYGAKKWNNQAAFEGDLLSDNWGDLKIPICISNQGIFVHYEVDG